jgi:hypothetical protein
MCRWTTSVFKQAKTLVHDGIVIGRWWLGDTGLGLAVGQHGPDRPR